MIALTTRTGRRLKITFIHSSHGGNTREDAGEARLALDALADIEGGRLTQCEIIEETNGNFAILGVGIAKCHAKDTFKKKTGCKISLTYALEAASDVIALDAENLFAQSDDLALLGALPPLTREDRKDVWDVYNTKTGVIVAPIAGTGTVNGTVAFPTTHSVPVDGAAVASVSSGN